MSEIHHRPGEQGARPPEPSEVNVAAVADGPVPGFGMDAIHEAARRLSGHVVRTPLLNSPMLDELVGARVLVKAECLQLTGSFKVRGALNALLTLDEDTRRAGIVAYSAGNHGQGVAAAARLAGCPAVIVMPQNAPRIKVDNCRWWGAETVLYDPLTEDREEIARTILQERGMTLIPPFDDPGVMAGQGTVGLEIAEQARELGLTPEVALVNCSGGGLAAGVITALHHTFPGMAHHIVEPTGFDKMARSLESGHVCTNPRPPGGLMDAISGPAAGIRPLAVLRHHDVTGLTVTDEEALAAMDTAHRLLKIVVEPGGAASLAALLSGKVDVRGRTVALVASGGNVDPAVYRRALAD
ncbi:threonine ammonia-lyase [Streptomyces melanosporofaciens]|uniref:threonine ammonia-lyase n=1 Tax=Streptomyces melanosporofaciens TaxID=67327 RepID=A0A1H4ZMA0_STRMJ|nr:threonine/serine dehydratase [Streptomyces melanosporofaciens]SED30788.1 threonine dehydratase [Streptomyces melanosporofaciens]